jgi:zeaxanthin glucosyltransferase
MNVLFAMAPEWGSIMPPMPLARELSSRGHRIWFCGPSPAIAPSTHVKPAQFRDFVERQGFPYSYYPDCFPTCRGRRTSYASTPWNRIHIGIKSILRAHAIDLLLVDPLMSAAVLAGVREQVCTVLLRPNVAGRISLRVPPFSSSAVPGDDGFRWRHMFREWIKHIVDWNRRAPGRLKNVTRMLTAAVRFRLPVEYTDLGLTVRLPALYLCPRAIEFASYPDRIYVGKVDTAREEPAYEWPHNLENAPLIFCSLGTNSHTLPGSARFFRVLVRALLARPQYCAIIQTGAACGPEDLDFVPDNVHLEFWVPQLTVLEKAAVMVTAGGLGSIKEAIYSRTPLIVFPGGYDQPGNAARVSYHGLGLRGDMESITPSKLAKMIDYILENRSTYLGRLDGMRSQVVEEADVMSAADKLERWRCERADNRHIPSRAHR